MKRSTFPSPRSACALLAALATLFALPAAADGGHSGGHSDANGHGGGYGHATARDIGSRVHALPRDHDVVRVRERPYYYDRRVFYRPWGRDYRIVRAPIGAYVSVLPWGWRSFWVGPRRYFFVDDDYFLWEPGRREYVVVRKPREADEALQRPEQVESTQVFAYPQRGQSAAQADRDRYDCHVWASGQSGFDPTNPGDARDLAGDYRRALTACLEGRGYSVR